MEDDYPELLNDNYERVNGIDFIPLSLILETLPEDERKAEIKRLKKVDPEGYKRYVKYCKHKVKRGMKAIY